MQTPAPSQGQFSIQHVRPLGEGGLGTVDVVNVTSTTFGGPVVGTQFARKRLSPRWNADPQQRARFEREITLLSEMDHPNIVAVEGQSLPGEERFYLMPLFAGSLRSAMTAGWIARGLDSAIDIGLKLADALDHAHSLNFIHRDLKPENVLLNDLLEPVVADWGLGQFIHQHSKVLNLTKGGPMGTHYYAPPEQWMTGRCDANGDVYSLGVMLAEIASPSFRMVPLTGIQADVLAPTTPRAHMFNDLVRRMAAINPWQRLQSMPEVAAHLTMLAAQR